MAHPRFNLIIPDDLRERIDTEAKARDCSAGELLRHYARLGLALTSVMGSDPAAQVTVKCGDREIVVLPI
jgi:hypothetical protein